jgi:hypothetical protein
MRRHRQTGTEHADAKDGCDELLEWHFERLLPVFRATQE